MVTLKKWTVDELLAFAKAGLLDPDKRIELINAEVYEMPPPGPEHAGTVNRLTQILVRALSDRAVVQIQSPVVLSLEDMPLPDFALLRLEPDFYTQHHPQPADIYLLGEVSDSTLSFDRAKKLKRYAVAGILEVWIVNLQDRYTEVYRGPKGEEYLTRFVVPVGDNVTSLAFPDNAVMVL